MSCRCFYNQQVQLLSSRKVLPPFPAALDLLQSLFSIPPNSHSGIQIWYRPQVLTDFMLPWGCFRSRIQLSSFAAQRWTKEAFLAYFKELFQDSSWLLMSSGKILRNSPEGCYGKYRGKRDQRAEELKGTHNRICNASFAQTYHRQYPPRALQPHQQKNSAMKLFFKPHLIKGFLDI